MLPSERKVIVSPSGNQDKTQKSNQAVLQPINNRAERRIGASGRRRCPCSGKIGSTQCHTIYYIVLQNFLIHVDSLVENNVNEQKLYKCIPLLLEKAVLCTWRGILCQEREFFIIKFWRETKQLPRFCYFMKFKGQAKLRLNFEDFFYSPKQQNGSRYFLFIKFHPEGEPEASICCVTKGSK